MREKAACSILPPDISSPESVAASIGRLADCADSAAAFFAESEFGNAGLPNHSKSPIATTARHSETPIVKIVQELGRTESKSSPRGEKASPAAHPEVTAAQQAGQTLQRRVVALAELLGRKQLLEEILQFPDLGSGIAWRCCIHGAVGSRALSEVIGLVRVFASHWGFRPGV
jgi:hypothetical protein